MDAHIFELDVEVDAHIFEVDVVLEAAKEAGLIPDPQYQARFPNDKLTTISINLFRSEN